MSDWRISICDVKLLINMYREHECLWNYKSELYKRIDLKKKAWESISNHFQKSVADCKKKVKNFRSAYVVEKKKVEDSLKSGQGIEEIHVPNLYYYDDFKFLDSVIVLRKTQSNFTLDDTLERAVEACEDQPDQPNSQEACVDEIPAASTTPSSFSRPQSRASGRRSVASSSARSARYEDAIAAILSKTSNSQQEPKSKYWNFGRSIACQLEDLTPVDAASAMSEVQQVLSAHLVRSFSRSSTSQSSSYSSGGELSDVLQSAMVNSDIFSDTYDN